MNKSDLIEKLSEQLAQLAPKDVDWAAKIILEHMSETLADGRRIEIRDFGSFSLRHRGPRTGRNPKTGQAVSLPDRHIPHFKPGKALRERVQAAYEEAQDRSAKPGAAVKPP